MGSAVVGLGALSARDTMTCPCCGADMRCYETLIHRVTGQEVAVLWVCEDCANEPPKACSCGDGGHYFQMPPDAELEHGGRHLL